MVAVSLAYGYPPSVPPGSKIFISVMGGELDGFIAAEIIKQNLPITVVTDEKDAEYILAGASIKADDKWYHVIFGGKDKNEGNVRLLDVKSRTMSWAGEGGDRSLWFAGFRRGGERKVAERIIRHMKKDIIFYKLPPPDPWKENTMRSK